MTTICGTFFFAMYKIYDILYSVFLWHKPDSFYAVVNLCLQLQACRL